MTNLISKVLVFIILALKLISFKLNFLLLFELINISFKIRSFDNLFGGFSLHVCIRIHILKKMYLNCKWILLIKTYYVTIIKLNTNNFLEFGGSKIVVRICFYRFSNVVITLYPGWDLNPLFQMGLFIKEVTPWTTERPVNFNCIWKETFWYKDLCIVFYNFKMAA